MRRRRKKTSLVKYAQMIAYYGLAGYQIDRVAVVQEQNSDSRYSSDIQHFTDLMPLTCLSLLCAQSALHGDF